MTDRVETLLRSLHGGDADRVSARRPESYLLANFGHRMLPPQTQQAPEQYSITHDHGTELSLVSSPKSSWAARAEKQLGCSQMMGMVQKDIVGG